MSTTATTSWLTAARAMAETVLRDLPDRWAHSAAVARRAQQIAVTVEPDDRELLVVAAWLHDIGYSRELRDTGFHPLDGATYLWRNGWPARICGLVAHHSGALYVARVRGLGAALDRFPHEQSPVSDALTYADQTVGPGGQAMTIEERTAEMLARRGPDSAQARVHHIRKPYLRAAATRVEQRLPIADSSYSAEQRTHAVMDVERDLPP